MTGCAYGESIGDASARTTAETMVVTSNVSNLLGLGYRGGAGGLDRQGEERRGEDQDFQGAAVVAGANVPIFRGPVCR